MVAIALHLSTSALKTNTKTQFSILEARPKLEVMKEIEEEVGSRVEFGILVYAYTELERSRGEGPLSSLWSEDLVYAAIAQD